MKNILFVFLSVLSIAIFSSCGKENDLSEDDILIQEIVSSTNKIVLDEEELPTTINSYTDESYFESFVDQSYSVSTKGFGLEMGNGEVLCFNTEGKRLRASKKFKGHGRPCGDKKNHEGEWVILEATELPSNISDYIAENYADETIKRAKFINSEAYIVALTGHVLLKFDSEGTFLAEIDCTERPPCLPGEKIEFTELPSSIQDYVTTNHADAEIKGALTIDDEKFIVALIIDGERKILGFDAEGNLIFEK